MPKKSGAPIELFKKLDISKHVMAEAKGSAKGFPLDKIILDIVLSDAKILEAFPDNDKDYSLLAQQMYDAANMKKIASDLADLLEDLIDNAKDSDVRKIQDALEKKAEGVMEAAAERASKVVQSVTKAKVDYRKYKVQVVIQIGASAAGLLMGALGLATAPLTAGSSTIIGAFALLQGVKGMASSVSSLAKTAEEAADDLAKHLGTLGKKYQDASKGSVGAQELGKTLANAVWPDAMKTLTGAKAASDVVGKKIAGLKVAAHDLADKLEDCIKKQEVAQKKLNEFEKSNSKVLTPADSKLIEKTVKATEDLGKDIEKVIGKIGDLVSRVDTTDKLHDKLSKELDKLAKKEPVWAQVGELVINVAAAVGFATGGNLNAPEAYKVTLIANQVSGIAGNIVGSAQTAKQAWDTVMNIIKGRKAA